MNQKEWKYLCHYNKCFVDFTYYNNTRKIQKSLQYNNDPKATIIHHLRDTEEQRKYNDEHYELWGFNLDGTFEYGKYVVFVTEEWHNKYHSDSVETRNRKSNAQRLLWQNPVIREKRIAGTIGHETSEETRKKISTANSGKVFTDEHREKLCIARRKRVISEDTKSKTSESMKFVMSNEEHRKQISETVKKQKLEKKLLYDEYKANGGVLKWNDFQSFLKHNFEKNYMPSLEELQDALTYTEDDSDIDVDDT